MPCRALVPRRKHLLRSFVLATMTGSKQLRKHTSRNMTKKIEDAIKGDTSGDFRRVLISMCAGARDEKENEDYSKAKDLARQLYAAGEGKWGTNEEEINRILAVYSFPMLRCVFADYRHLRGEDFGSVISKELSGDMKTGMKAIYRTIENRAGYFARRLHDAMAGAGTDDKVLMRIVVSRAEIDM